MNSTKVCPKCGESDMISLMSTNTKLCNTCGNEIPWPLEEGQKRVFDKIGSDKEK